MGSFITEIEISYKGAFKLVEAEIDYTFHKGRCQTSLEPAEDAHCTIDGIKVKVGDKWTDAIALEGLFDDEELEALALNDYVEWAMRNAEDRADAMREERMLNRGQ